MTDILERARETICPGGAATIPRQETVRGAYKAMIDNVLASDKGDK